ncbi:MAG: hypothetical protein ACPG5U_10120 [Planktomarina sp.]
MDYNLGNRWRLRITFVVIVTSIVFVQTLPIYSERLRLLSPDIVLAFTFAWAVRRPDAITPVLIVLVTVLTDFLLHRPPGLWTVIVLLAAIFLQGRVHDIRHSVYSAEWFLVGLVILGTFAVYQAALIVTLTGGHDWITLGLLAMSTVVIYPFVTLISQRVFGVHKPGVTDPNTY